MATSGVINTQTKYGSYFWVKWNVSSQSVAENKTTIAWSCGLTPGEQYYSNAVKMGAVVIDGKTVYSGGTYSDITDYKDHTFASGTLELAHNNDGTRSFTVGAFTGWLYGNGDYTASAHSFTLPTIPRASAFSTSGSTLGSAVKITITRASTSFTHKLYYTCGSIQKQSIATGVATSYSWTPPIDLAAKAPNGATVATILICETYNGDTLVGTTSRTLSLAIPASVVPTLSVALNDPTENSITYGGYVQLRSKVKAVITAAGAQGSTIKAYSIKAGSFYSYSGEKSSGESGFIPVSGSLSVVCTVTDSRGRTASKTQAITVLAYATPTISSISAARCNQDGTVNRSGTYGKVAFSGAITSLNKKNTASYTVQYREIGSTVWMDAGSTAEGNYAPKNASVVFAADQSKRYEVRVLAKDAFETAGIGSSIRDLPASFVLQHLAKSLLSIGIGRLCDKSKAIQVGLPAYFDASIFADRYLFMGGNKATNTEKSIWYQTTEGAAKPHNVQIYGGNGESTAAWGVYDVKNSRSVIRYDDAAGTLTLLGLGPTSLTVMAGDTALKNFSATARHFPGLQVGILRIYGETTAALPAGATYSVAGISEHIPTSTYALSVYCLKALNGRLNASGVVQIRPQEDIPAGYGIYLAGFWIAA